MPALSILKRPFSLRPTRVIVIGFLLCVVQHGLCQTAKKIRLTDQSVVKDSSGKIYAAKEWAELLKTGRYGIVPENVKDSNTAFVLKTLTEEELRMRTKYAMRPPESSFFTTGRGIAGFSGKDVEGNRYKLRELEGKVVVINFWFIACAPCQMEIPELNQVVNDYKDSSSIVFLAIALDEQREVMKFLEKKKFNYNIISDGAYISRIYGIKGYPTHVVLDKQGKVVFHTTGYGSATVPWLRKSITSALQQ